MPKPFGTSKGFCLRLADASTPLVPAPFPHENLGKQGWRAIWRIFGAHGDQFPLCLGQTGLPQVRPPPGGKRCQLSVCPFSSNRNQAVAASESHTLIIKFGVSENSMVSKCEAPTWQGSVNTFTPKQPQLNQRASKCIRRCWKIGSEGPLRLENRS